MTGTDPEGNDLVFSAGKSLSANDFRASAGKPLPFRAILSTCFFKFNLCSFLNDDSPKTDNLNFLKYESKGLSSVNGYKVVTL